MSDYDGQAPSGGPVRPKFGTREWWHQQPDLAIDILILWRQRQPALFGAYLAEVMTDTKPKAARGE